MDIDDALRALLALVALPAELGSRVIDTLFERFSEVYCAGEIQQRGLRRVHARTRACVSSVCLRVRLLAHAPTLPSMRSAVQRFTGLGQLQFYSPSLDREFAQNKRKAANIEPCMHMGLVACWVGFHEMYVFSVKRVLYYKSWI